MLSEDWYTWMLAQTENITVNLVMKSVDINKQIIHFKRDKQARNNSDLNVRVVMSIVMTHCSRQLFAVS